MTVKIKRIYDEVSEDDGIRVLVDRLWPRGISKDKAKLDHWLKEVGPSNELRKWFHQDADENKFEEFKQKYRSELQSGKQQEALEELKQIAEENGHVTLLFSAKNEKQNQAQILVEMLDS